MFLYSSNRFMSRQFCLEIFGDNLKSLLFASELQQTKKISLLSVTGIIYHIAFSA